MGGAAREVLRSPAPLARTTRSAHDDAEPEGGDRARGSRLGSDEPSEAGPRPRKQTGRPTGSDPFTKGRFDHPEKGSILTGCWATTRRTLHRVGVRHAVPGKLCDHAFLTLVNTIAVGRAHLRPGRTGTDLPAVPTSSRNAIPSLGEVGHPRRYLPPLVALCRQRLLLTELGLARI